jgi:hypothetical protein
VDRLFVVEDAYTLTLLTAKLTFVRQLIQEIKDGTLTEMRDEQRIWKTNCLPMRKRPDGSTPRAKKRESGLCKMCSEHGPDSFSVTKEVEASA